MLSNGALGLVVIDGHSGVLVTVAGAGRCRQIHVEKLTIVCLGDMTLGATVCSHQNLDPPGKAQ